MDTDATGVHPALQAAEMTVEAAREEKESAQHQYEDALQHASPEGCIRAKQALDHAERSELDALRVFQIIRFILADPGDINYIPPLLTVVSPKPKAAQSGTRLSSRKKSKPARKQRTKDKPQPADLRSQPQRQRRKPKNKAKKQPSKPSPNLEDAKRDAERRRELELAATQLHKRGEMARFQDMLAQARIRPEHQGSVPPCQCGHGKSSHSVERGCVAPKCQCRNYRSARRKSSGGVRVVSGGLPTLGRRR